MAFVVVYDAVAAQCVFLFDSTEGERLLAVTRMGERRTASKIAGLRMLLACAIAFIVGCGEGASRTKEPPDLERSIVQVHVGDRAWATGFAVASGRQIFIATSYHLLRSPGRIVVVRWQRDGDRWYRSAFVDAVVEGVDAGNDLAVLSVPTMPPDALLPLKISTKPADVGTRVRAAVFTPSTIASSGQLGPEVVPPVTVPPGAVQSIVQTDTTDLDTGATLASAARQVLVVTMPLKEGNSGGALLDENNHVVGVAIRRDADHILQDGAVDAVYLRNLLVRIQEHADAHAAYLDDLDAARKSVEEALEGTLSVSRVDTTPLGNLLMHEDRAPLANIIKQLLQLYAVLPEQRNPDAWRNLFSTLGGKAGFARSKRVTFSSLTGACLGGEHAATDSLPALLLDLLSECATRRLLPEFARDTMEAMLAGGGKIRIESLVVLDEPQRVFEAKARLADGTLTSIRVALRGDGWHLVLTDWSNGHLVGQYQVPDGYLPEGCLTQYPDDVLYTAPGDDYSGIHGPEHYAFLKLSFGFVLFQIKASVRVSGIGRVNASWQGFGFARRGVFSRITLHCTGPEGQCNKNSRGALYEFKIESSGDLTGTYSSGTTYRCHPKQ